MNASVAQPSRLAYEEQGSGFPIVFLHGLTFNRGTWRLVTDRLAGRFRCVLIDLPGHGESAGLPASLEEVARDVHQLVTDLGIERPVIVGHSLGGMMVTFYAANFPVAGVVNVDQPLDIEQFAQMLHEMETALRSPNFSAVFEPIRQSIGVELLPEPIRSNTLATQTVRQDLVLAYWNEPLQQTPEDLQTSIEVAAKNIEVPYLAVFGHELSADERDRLRGRLQTLELEEWPARGHMVYLMEPERFADRLAAFVERCEASS